MDDNNEILNNSIIINDTSTSPSSTETDSQSPITPSENVRPMHTKKKIIVRNLPSKNTREMIILCLDTCVDPDFTPFKLGDGSTYPPIYMLKRVIEIFVQNKNFNDTKHEFALVTLNSKNVNIIEDFTNNPRQIVKSLVDIKESEADNSDEFDLGILLDEVVQMVSIPKPDTDLSIPLDYNVRLIILYSRSYCTPILRKDFSELFKNPYFTVDVLMTNEESLEDNKLQEIFDSLQIDPKENSYNFSVGRNPTTLHDSMAKLLSHPLQRPLQNEACYRAPDIEKEE